MGALRRIAPAVLVALSVGLGTVSVPTMASAAPGDIGYQGPSFSGVNHAPTADKAQSKLWFHDGRWWADMFDPVSKDWHIFWLNRSTNTWTDTGVAIDTRPYTSADVLWDGSKLYVASHAVRDMNVPSKTGLPAKLYRYSYVPATKTWVPDAGFPKTINDVSSEALTIDKDSTGTIWATWTQVSGTTTADFTSSVYVNSATDGGSTWGTPFVMPATGTNPNPMHDDISTVVAFGKNKVGVLWSNQLDDTVYWAVHNDGAAATDWRGSVALRGPSEADDHVNVKAIQSDTAGRVFAVVKTAFGDAYADKPTDPLVKLLVFKPGTGSWTSSTVATVADCYTRPQLALDESSQKVHVMATGPTGTGTCTTARHGAIYMKSAPMDNPVFPSGLGTRIIRDVASENLNDVTLAKHSVTSESGLVVLASNVATKRYWHHDSLGTPPVSAALPYSHNFDSNPATDVLAARSDGALILYPGDGKGGFASPYPQIGTGWQTVDMIRHAGDFDRNGTRDIIARDKANGNLYLYPGNGSGGITGRKTIGWGWNVFSQIIASGDFNGDGNPDLVTVRPDGVMHLYPGNGMGGFGSSYPQIGAGWHTRDQIISVGDWDGDGRNDLVAREPANGRLWLYSGSGTGGFSSQRVIGYGWGIFSALVGPGDFNGDKANDILARRTNGDLYLYPGNGKGGFGSSYPQIGAGWAPLTIVSAGTP